MRIGNGSQFHAIIDLDGTVADFEEGFQNFVKSKMGTRIPTSPENYFLEKAVMQFGEEKGQELIAGFYGEEGRGFAKLPVIGNSVRFVHLIRRLGFKIHFVTCRPVDKFPNIAADTLGWLVTNGFEFDTIDIVKSKAEFADGRWSCKGKGALAIEDNPPYVEQLLTRSGFGGVSHVFMPEYEYNSGLRYDRTTYYPRAKMYESLSPHFIEYAASFGR